MKRLSTIYLSLALLCTSCTNSSSNNFDTVNLTSQEPIFDYLAAYKEQIGTVKKHTDLRIYQIMVESFQDGDPNRNYDVGYGPSSHKGDLRGVLNSLDYIKSLNMNAIWLTPIFESAPSDKDKSKLDATGYYTRNYYKIDRNFGDENTLKELVDKAHEKGIYVILDGVFGHFRDDLVNTSPKGNKISTTDKCIGSNKSFYPPVAHTLCTDFNDGGKSLEYFKELVEYYIETYKIDGFRLDQAYQIPVENLSILRKTIEDVSKKVEYTNYEGKSVHPLGYVVGEIWSDNPTIVSTGYGDNENIGLYSNFDFALRYGLVQTLATEEWGKQVHVARNIRDLMKYDEINFPAHAMPNFMITNHDLVRFGDLIQRAGLQDSYWQRIHLALSFLALVPSGPITNYYGEEIGQEVPDFDKKISVMDFYDDHVSRDNGKISGFTQQEEKTKDLFSYLMKIRSEHDSISNGKLLLLKANSDIFAVKKTHSNDSDFIYVMNISNENKLISISKDIADKKKYERLITKKEKILQASEDGDIQFILEPLSFDVIRNTD